MDRRSLIATYFRQQAELHVPDPFVDSETIQLITGISPISRGTAVSATPTGKPLPQVKPSSSTRTPLSLKKRLSSLRPVDQLVISAATKMERSTIPPTKKNVDEMQVCSDKRTALRDLFVAGCTRCHLSQTRTKFVFGSGNAEAPVMVIGEAPGQEEDDKGLPFVGAAGKLLTSMLTAINIDRTTDLFITNVLKCHPPKNRNPESSEIVTCIPLLKRQIEIISPRALLLLGRIAAHAVLDINDSVSKMRSRIFDYHGIPTMVIYHPAALLHNTDYKRPAWEDLQQFQKLLISLGIYGSLRKE